MPRTRIDLAHEDDAPGQHGGGPAAEDGTDRDARTGDAPDHGVGDLAVLALEVARDQRDHRRQHQCGADALEHRPAQGQDRDARCDRREARSARVDGETDHERPAPADDVTDLAAGEHQHGHHEAVEGDDRLDRRDRRVEVDDQLADRDVHHGLVEDHDELGASERDQRPSPLHRTILRSDACRTGPAWPSGALGLEVATHAEPGRPGPGSALLSVGVPVSPRTRPRRPWRPSRRRRRSRRRRVPTSRPWRRGWSA